MQNANLVKISSEDRDPESISASDFVVSYNNAPCMSNVNRLAVKNVIVPNVFYNINNTGYNIHNNGNNVVTINNISDAFEFTLTIPRGNYTVDELITAINLLLSGAGVGLILSQDTVTKKLVFTSTGDLFGYSTDRLGGYLGMINPPPLNGAGVLVYELEGFVNLSGVKEVYISSSRMSDGSHLVVPFGGSKPVIAAVPITVGFGEFQTYISPSLELDEIIFPSYSAGSNLRTIDIQVRDNFGNILDTGGLPTTMTCKVFHLQN